jgi:enterochelin esterase family protein
LLWLAAGIAVAQQSAPPRVQSPEWNAAGDLTLRIRAPQASSVRLTSGGDIPGLAPGPGQALRRDADGVWSVTLPGVGGGGYRYSFSVDGVATLDPNNRHVSESNGNAWSLVYVPGQDFMNTNPVPHGAVAEVTYASSVLGRHRRMHVYTPPGYERGSARYPVLYLLHGAMDSDDSWSTVGRAGSILDNLIAAGKAESMIVVMPDGHTAPFTLGASSLPIADFTQEFTKDIKPYIESHYRARTGRNDTAIAGLSMGGAQTLEIATTNLDRYAYIGVYSSGVFGIGDDTSWEDAHRSQLDDAKVRAGLKLLWFATGSEDCLLDTTKQTVAMFDRHGFDVKYVESGGGHTWINWREYLATFAPQLFKN